MVFGDQQVAITIQDTPVKAAKKKSASMHTWILREEAGFKMFCGDRRTFSTCVRSQSFTVLVSYFECKHTFCLFITKLLRAHLKIPVSCDAMTTFSL